MVLFQYERTPGFSFSITTNRALQTTTFTVSEIPSTATLPNDGQWHHIAVVHTDGVDSKFFIDGALASTISYTGGIGARTNSRITLGASYFGANQFTGFLDRISFHNQALSAAQLDFPAALSLGARTAGNTSPSIGLRRNPITGYKCPTVFTRLSGQIFHIPFKETRTAPWFRLPNPRSFFVW